MTILKYYFLFLEKIMNSKNKTKLFYIDNIVFDDYYLLLFLFFLFNFYKIV